jgi:hypothetical protein
MNKPAPNRSALLKAYHAACNKRDALAARGPDGKDPLASPKVLAAWKAADKEARTIRKAVDACK